MPGRDDAVEAAGLTLYPFRRVFIVAGKTA
jgi:trans-aconitate methyltransferase